MNKKLNCNIRLFAAVLIVISIFFTSVITADAAEISGLDAVTVTNGKEGTSTITGSHSNNSSTTATTTTLTLTGDSTNLDGIVGELTFKVQYTLKTGAKKFGTQGTAGITAATSGVTTKTLSGDAWDSSNNTFTSEIFTVTVPNWTKGSTWSITMSASAAERLNSYEASSVSVTISELKFSTYEMESVIFAAGTIPYTISYYADAEAATMSTVTIPTESTGISVNGALNRGMSISLGAGYYCACIQAVRSGSTVTLGAGTNSFIPSNGDEITPLFAYDANGVAPFSVDGVSYYTWETAIDAAVASTSSKMVILADDYTLPAAGDKNVISGNLLLGQSADTALEHVVLTNDNDTITAVTYKIPSGVKFLIPYEGDTTGCFNLKPTFYSEETVAVFYNTQAAYRTLTVNGNTTLECSGQMSVNGEIWTGSIYAGIPYGISGRVKLAAESANLVVKSGGLLACYGYIVGDYNEETGAVAQGTVTLEGNATLYESFQALGFRGGAATEKWATSSGVTEGDYSNPTFKSFAFSDYAVQNVETNLQINYGANVQIVASMEASGELQQIDTYFIGSNQGFLRIKDSASSIHRSYDPISNRVTYTTYGNIDIGSIALAFSGLSLDTQNHIFGVNNNLSFVIRPGSTVNLLYKYKLMPGATVTICDGDTPGKLVVNGDLYLYDWDDFVEDASFSSFHQGWPTTKSIPVVYIATTGATSNFMTPVWNGITALQHWTTKTTPITVNGVLEVTSTGMIYTSSNGHQCINKLLKGTGTFINNSEKSQLVVSDVLDEFQQYYYSPTSSEFWENGLSTAKMVDVNITVTPAVGLIAGLSEDASDYRCFEAGKTYYGSADGYWYEYTVSAVTDGGEPQIVGYVGNGSTITFNDSNVASDLTVANGSFTYTTPSTCYEVANSNGTLTKGDDGVTYTLTGITANTILTITENHTEDVDEAVAATCTTTGLTEGSHCSVCSTVLVAQEVVAALGHTEVTDAAVAATCTTTGLTEGSHCSVCNTVLVAQEVVPTLGHTPETQFVDIDTVNSTCTRVVDCDCGVEISRETNVPMVQLDAINASADSEIILMLYFTDSHSLLDDATATVTMTTNGNVLPSEDFKFEQAGERYLVSQPVASGEMTSPVTVTFTDAQDNVIPVYDYIEGTCSDSVTKTVTDYAERVLEVGDDRQKKIIQALVTYGGYSQLNFGTNTSDLAYSILDEVPTISDVTISSEDYSVSRSGDSIGITQTTQQAYLDSAIYLRVFFVLNDGMEIDNYKFTLTSPKGDSTVTTDLTPTEDGSRYYVEINNIPAAYLDNDYTITVTGNGGTYTVKTSVFAYLKDLLDNSTDEKKINAAKAMYLYGTAATTFFGR